MADPTAYMKKSLPPCRLYAILARAAPVAVIFRRGPSKRVQIIHWDTDTDTFTPGQWFHGRIYERRNDLSSNGQLLIYRTEKASVRNRQEGYSSSWTAISKPPYLTALALWPCHSAIGGGLFFSDEKVWLNHFGNPIPHRDHLPFGVYVYTSGQDISELALLNRRLERDGWRHAQEWQGELVGKITGGSHYVNHAPGIHEKRHPRQDATLVMTTTLNGFAEKYRYSVRQGDGKILYLNSAEWADWDKRGRLVLAQDGKISAQDAGAVGQESPTELIDLNGNQPEPMTAPEWAKTW